MDRLAEKLEMDPLAFRLKNYARKEDGDQDRKIPFASVGLEECAKRGAELIGWETSWKKPGTSPGPVKRGLGVAFQSCRHGLIMPPMSAIIKLDPDGTVELLSGLNDSGGWQKTTMAMRMASKKPSQLLSRSNNLRIMAFLLVDHLLFVYRIYFKASLSPYIAQAIDDHGVDGD